MTQNSPHRAHSADRPPETPRSRRRRNLAHGALLGGFAFFLGLQKIGDFDYWTNLALGRALWQARALHIVEPFLSGAGPGTTVPPSWPFALLLYGVHAVGAEAGVGVAVAALAGLTAVLFWNLSSVPEDRARRSWAWAFAALVLFASRTRFTPRPEVLGYVLAGISFPTAYSWRKAPSLGKLGIVALLFAVWQFAHVGWTVGAAVVGAYLITGPAPAFWAAQWRGGWRRRLGLALLFAAVLFAVPVAARFAAFVLRDLQAGGSLSAITEMQPLWTFPELAVPFWVAAGVGLLLCWGAREGRARRLVIWAGAVCLGTLAARNVAFAAFAMLPPGLEGAAALRVGLPRRLPALLAAACAAALGALALADPAQPWGLGVRWELFPRDAAAFVKRGTLPGPFLNSLDIGGYLDWAWQGRPATFIDGRVGGENQAFSDLRRVSEGESPSEVLDRRGIRGVITRAVYYDSGRVFPLVFWLLGRPEWRLVRATDALVFAREPLPAGVVPLDPRQAWRYLLWENEVNAAEGGDRPHYRYNRALAWNALGDGARALVELQAAIARSGGWAGYYLPAFSGRGLPGQGH